MMKLLIFTSFLASCFALDMLAFKQQMKELDESMIKMNEDLAADLAGIPKIDESHIP
jgi:hypothetical protein